MEKSRKKSSYPYEYINCINDYEKAVVILEKEDFLSKLRNKGPYDIEIEGTKKIVNLFHFGNGGQLTKLNFKNDVVLLTYVFEKVMKVSNNEFDLNPLYCVSVPGFTSQNGLKYTIFTLQTLQDKHLILLLESKVRGAISSVMGDRYVVSYDKKKIMYEDANNPYGH